MDSSASKKKVAKQVESPKGDTTMTSGAAVDGSLLRNILRSSFISVDGTDCASLAAACAPVEFGRGTNCIDGPLTQASEFFIISSGTANVVRGDDILASLKAGDYFGESALVRDVPFDASINAQEDVKAFKITRDIINETGLNRKLVPLRRIAVCADQGAGTEIKEASPKTPDEIDRIKDAVRRNENLNTWISLNDHMLNAMIGCMWKEPVMKGTKIIEQGYMNPDHFYVVASGSFEQHQPQESQSMACRIERGNRSTFGPGTSFGEMCLLHFTPCISTIQATADSSVFVLTRKQFKDILMEAELAEVGDTSSVGTMVTAHISCNNFSDITVTITTLAGSQLGEFMFSLEACISELEIEVQRNLCWESMSFLSDEGSIMKSTTKLKEYGRLTIKRDETVEKDAEKKETHIYRKDLKRLGLLGCGGFGAVEVVEHVHGGGCFALKVISKGYIMKTGIQKRILMEKTLQAKCESPFVIKLYETYNGVQSLYFLFEFAQGGDLYATYFRNGLWGNEKCAMFYIASTVLAFEHLHDRKIIFRDLKPENLVVASEGHAKLTDFGLAKMVIGKTFTTCGTPEYFAPEIIASRGHMQGVDWWTLGVLNYELLAGHSPFVSISPSHMFQKVMSGIDKIHFPKTCQGNVESLIRNNCHAIPCKRLPMQEGGSENIKNHAWYTGFDWAALENLTLPPPYKPAIKSGKDLANFVARKEDMPCQIPYRDPKTGWDKDFATSS